MQRRRTGRGSPAHGAAPSRRLSAVVVVVRYRPFQAHARGGRSATHGALRVAGLRASRSAAGCHVETGERPCRLVLSFHVSGSMESYARALIRFVHAAVGRTKEQHERQT